MADINEIITLGIGTPADIVHFVLVGLSTNPASAPTEMFGFYRTRHPFGERVTHHPNPNRSTRHPAGRQP